jgi:CheY-like chemotaxis protein
MSLKVVYVDDEVELCEIFQYTFEAENVSITTFTDPAVAFEAIAKSTPDLIFVDFRLPKTTGDEFALSLPPNIPKFLVTGDIMLETKYPFTKIFPKPYRKEEIQSCIANYLK